MINLDEYVQNVWKADTIESKREHMKKLIEVSHAKAQTKEHALKSIQKLSLKQLDKFAVNYSFAGDGLKSIA